METVDTIYKNGIVDTATWSKTTNNAYGKQATYTAIANADQAAIYSIDGRRLATEAPQIGTVAISYNTGLTEAIADLQIQMNAKQTKDPALDRVVSFAEYEKTKYQSHVATWFANGGTLYVRAVVPVQKKSSPTPSITVNNLSIQKANGFTDVTANFVIEALMYADEEVLMTYRTTDATTITDIKANGVAFASSVTLDARKGA